MRAVLIGILTAASVAGAAPAFAQGVYLGVPGIGVQIGPGYVDDRHGYEGPRYRSYHSPQYGYDAPYASECRTFNVQRRDGSWRTVRRCN